MAKQSWDIGTPLLQLGEILIGKGLITRDDLRLALENQVIGDEKLGIQPKELLGKTLVKMGKLKPMQLVRTLCEQKGTVDFIAVGDYLVEPRVVLWIPEEMAEEYSVLPLVSLGEDMLMVATARPLTEEEKADITSVLDGTRLETLQVKDDDIVESIKSCYKMFLTRGLSGARIGEILVRDGFVAQNDLQEALHISKKSQRMVGKVLIELGKVNENDFFKVLSLQRRIPLVSSNDIISMLDRTLAKKINKTFCMHNFIVPYLLEGETLYLVTAEPSIDPIELKKALKCKQVHINLATYSDITRIFKLLFVEEELKGLKEVKGKEVKLEEVEIVDDEELVDVSKTNIDELTKKYQNITNSILLQAIQKGASDIHIENYEKRVVLRFRIDGTLYDIEDIKIGKEDAMGVINVVKINANLNIAERRLPQGGRFRRKAGKEKTFDFRVQSQPTLHGENLVLRILKQSGELMELEDLGFLPDLRARYEQLISNPSGLVLFTGPTGCGKTTTLYSTLGLLRKDMTKKIVTIEDPIEYSIDRVQQSQAKEEIGFSFPQAIRSFLRQDPDVMLVGEIRDRDTALETLRASQTGHLVFSTIHVNSAVETIQRLLDFDLVPGTVAAELLAIVAQRLAKKNCDFCKVKYRPAKELIDSFYPNGVPSSIDFYRGEGCERCDFMGHKGRVAVLEFWFVDVESKRLIIEGAGHSELYRHALSRGLLPMIKDALVKVESGLISLDELPNIIPFSQISHWTGM
jgi:type IV pilus assembly protein PilB